MQTVRNGMSSGCHHWRDWRGRPNWVTFAVPAFAPVGDATHNPLVFCQVLAFDSSPAPTCNTACFPPPKNYSNACPLSSQGRKPLTLLPCRALITFCLRRSLLPRSSFIYSAHTFLKAYSVPFTSSVVVGMHWCRADKNPCPQGVHAVARGDSKQTLN